MIPAEPNPSPQPVIAVTAPSDVRSTASRATRRLRRLVIEYNKPSSGSDDRVIVQPAPLNPAVLRAAVLILSCEVTEPFPGVRTGCEKVAVAPGGSPPAESVTDPGNVPFVAATVMVYCAVTPGRMV
jgi:hypothetical protein